MTSNPMWGNSLQYVYSLINHFDTIHHRACNTNVLSHNMCFAICSRTMCLRLLSWTGSIIATSIHFTVSIFICWGGGSIEFISANCFFKRYWAKNSGLPIYKEKFEDNPHKAADKRQRKLQIHIYAWQIQRIIFSLKVKVFKHFFFADYWLFSSFSIYWVKHFSLCA